MATDLLLQACDAITDLIETPEQAKEGTAASRRHGGALAPGRRHAGAAAAPRAVGAPAL